jgi:glutamine amidotransferase
MPNINIVVIDYGLGNLFSVVKAFLAIGVEASLTDKAEAIKTADAIVLPGVGAFKDGMEGLKGRGLVESIKEHAFKNKPFLGICLGMQMMLSESEEFGLCQGLDLIKGRVIRLPHVQNQERLKCKIPNIGWKKIFPSSQNDKDLWNNTILNNLPQEAYFYFVHSFVAAPDDAKDILANINYGGNLACSVIRRGNLFGTQFHPEKSADLGLDILRNFIKIVGNYREVPYANQ